MEKSITELIIELEDVKRNLDRIKNDPEYIEQKVAAIFNGKKYSPDREQIEALFLEV